MISARVELTQPLKQQRQFVAQTGSGHDFLLDHTAGGTGLKPIERVSAALAGCTALDVITILRYDPSTFATFNRRAFHSRVAGARTLGERVLVTFTAFVALNLLESGFTNWCPMMTFLRKLGVGNKRRAAHGRLDLGSGVAGGLCSADAVASAKAGSSHLTQQ